LRKESNREEEDEEEGEDDEEEEEGEERDGVSTGEKEAIEALRSP